MSTKKNETPANVCVIEARLCYGHLQQPTKAEGSETAKYNGQFLFPKEDKKTLATLNVAFQAGLKMAKEKGKIGPDASFKLSEIVKDGDKPNKKGKSRGPEYKGMYYISAKSENKPGVAYLNANKKMVEALKEDDVYSGCIVKAQVSIFGFKQLTGAGMAVGLNHVLKIKDGPKLSGGAGDIKDAFSEYAAEEGSDDFGLDEEFSLEEDDDDIFS